MDPSPANSISISGAESQRQDSAVGLQRWVGKPLTGGWIPGRQIPSKPAAPCRCPRKNKQPGGEFLRPGSTFPGHLNNSKPICQYKFVHDIYFTIIKVTPQVVRNCQNKAPRICLSDTPLAKTRLRGPRMPLRESSVATALPMTPAPMMMASSRRMTDGQSME